MTKSLALLSLAVASVASAQSRVYLGPSYTPSTDSGFQAIPRPQPGSTSGGSFAQTRLGLYNGNISGSVTGAPTGQRGLRLTTTGFNYLNPTQTIFGGYGYVQASSINAGGTAIGISAVFSGNNQLGTVAARWAVGSTTPTLIGTLGQASGGQRDSTATAINATGVIVGNSTKYVSGQNVGLRPVRWAAGATTPTELLVPTAATSNFVGVATGVNDSGLTIGFSDRIDNGQYRGYDALRWAPNSAAFTRLNSLGTRSDGYEFAQPSAVNNAGTIVGASDRIDNNTQGFVRPVRWAAGSTTPTELGIVPLGGNSPSGFRTGNALAINTRGDSVGELIYSSDDEFLTRSLRWAADSTTPVVLQGVTATSNTRVADINNVGVAVGYSATASDQNHAMLWTATGQAIDISTRAGAGRIFSEAAGVSTTGFVSGFAIETAEGTTYNRAVLLLIPEAGTFGLGDANFDESIGFPDLVQLAGNYNKLSNGSIDTADFNMDGITNFPDLVTLAASYNDNYTGNLTQFSRNFQDDWELAQSMVPEPMAMAWVVLSGSLLLRRRRASVANVKS